MVLALRAHAARRRRERVGDERGAAAIEFALVMVPLLLIVFGIISFGVMLSFRQTLSQAATEGARAAAVELNAGNREAEGLAAINDALNSIDMACGQDGLVCDVGDPTACGTAECVTVTLTYPYRANPIVPSVPLIELTLPEVLEYSATVRVS